MSRSSYLNRMEIQTLALGVIVSVVLLIVSEPQSAASFLAGAGVGVLNFGVIRLVVARLLAPGQQDRQGVAAMLLALKFAAMALVVFVLITLVGLDATMFGAGLATLLVGLVFETLRTQLSSRSE